MISLTAMLSAGLIAAGLVSGSGQPAPFDIESAPVPASCQHPAARLQGGVRSFGTRPDGSSRGDVSLVPRPYSTAVPIAHPIVALQRGTSRRGAAVAAPIRCSAGGVDYPQLVVLYSRTGRILAFTSLHTRQEHAAVSTIALRGDHMHVRWVAYDGAGFHRHRFEATFVLRVGALVRSR